MAQEKSQKEAKETIDFLENFGHGHLTETEFNGLFSLPGVVGRAFYDHFDGKPERVIVFLLSSDDVKERDLYHALTGNKQKKISVQFLEIFLYNILEYYENINEREEYYLHEEKLKKFVDNMMKQAEINAGDTIDLEQFQDFIHKNYFICHWLNFCFLVDPNSKETLFFHLHLFLEKDCRSGKCNFDNFLSNNIYEQHRDQFRIAHHYHHNNTFSAPLYVNYKEPDIKYSMTRFVILKYGTLFLFENRTDTTPFRTLWIKDCEYEKDENNNQLKLSHCHCPINSITLNFDDPGTLDKWANEISGIRTRKFEEVYEIVYYLGSGTYGQVYKCRHKTNNKFFAVKKLEIGPDLSTEDVMEEIGMLKLLKHPCTVHAIDIFETPKIYYIVMYLYEGGDLSECLPLNDEEIRKAMFHLLIAVEYIHKMGILHRDIKPQNIFLRKEREFNVVLGDYGLSYYITPKLVVHDTRFIGSPIYMAPEIAIKGIREYGFKVDVYSCGITFLQILGASLKELSDLAVYKNEPNEDQKERIKILDRIFKKNNCSKKFYCFVVDLIKDACERPTARQALAMIPA